MIFKNIYFSYLRADVGRGGGDDDAGGVGLTGQDDVSGNGRGTVTTDTMHTAPDGIRIPTDGATSGSCGVSSGSRGVSSGSYDASSGLSAPASTKRLHGASGDLSEPALFDVSLVVERGSRVVVLGANGSGKSTLARLANGLLLPQRGQVLVDDLDTGDPKSIFELRSRLALVSQNPDNQIVSTTVFDEVAFGPQNLGWPVQRILDAVHAALAAVGFADAITKRDPNTLSGGEKQRLVIAAALAMDPHYLVLDEPTAMLDADTSQEVLAAIEAAQRLGCGILHITHDLAEAALADTAVVLDHGQVVFSGSPPLILTNRAVLERHGLYCDPLSKPKVGPAAEPVAESFLRPALPGQTLWLNDVHFTYAPGTEYANPVLCGINVRLHSGVCTLLVGRSGSGKSTLLRIAAGLLKPTAGQVAIVSDNGQSDSANTEGTHAKNVNTEGDHASKYGSEYICACVGGSAAARAAVHPGQVGIVFQRPENQLFAQTLTEDILFGPRNIGLLANQGQPQRHQQEQRIVFEALRSVGLPPELFAQRSPFGLSGGEARRAAIATTLAMRTPFLLLDEPTAGLDARGKAFVYQLLERLLDQGIGILVATHDPDYFQELARVCLELQSVASSDNKYSQLLFGQSSGKCQGGI
ncbi:MAG: ATP-binding cassette domain-containing protein [Coriobacteriales bacterium]|nr:ATP-binding cassette domain-containing protein [Coriobacteriales bacterium]